MRRINLLYLLVIPLAFVWYKMHSNLSQQSVFFYGFAENKETEISHDKDVLIGKIHVTTGQEVKKGDLLMEVSQDDIDYKINQVDHRLTDINLELSTRKTTLLNRIAQLEARKEAKVKAIDLQISEVEEIIEKNNSLLQNLKSIEVAHIDDSDSPHYQRIKSLQQLKAIEVEPIDLEIAQIKFELNSFQQPFANVKKQMNGEKEYLKTEKQKLRIVAPSDGMIGNILCKEGENISSFTSLLNFYEPRPTIVKGFVHESLILAVKKTDSLQITSSLHQDLKVYGKVIGLGNRIVEIPERMRKTPEIKTYGREVLIKIPSDNPFLQKEKVFLNAIPQNTSSVSLITDTSRYRKQQTSPSSGEVIVENLK